MAEVCAICEADTFGDSHWHNELEAWCCPDHCDEPECIEIASGVVVPDDTAGPAPASDACDTPPSSPPLAPYRGARKRSRLTVEIDLDPVPGWGNTPEDHAVLVQSLLNKSVPHYNPTVVVA